MSSWTVETITRDQVGLADVESEPGSSTVVLPVEYLEIAFSRVQQARIFPRQAMGFFKNLDDALDVFSTADDYGFHPLVFSMWQDFSKKEGLRYGGSVGGRNGNVVEIASNTVGGSKNAKILEQLDRIKNSEFMKAAVVNDGQELVLECSGTEEVCRTLRKCGEMMRNGPLAGEFKVTAFLKDMPSGPKRGFLVDSFDVVVSAGPLIPGGVNGWIIARGAFDGKRGTLLLNEGEKNSFFIYENHC